MALLKLVPTHTAIPFTRLRWVAAAISGVLIVASLALLATRGLNLGVDFRGGVTVEASAPGVIDVAGVRSAVGALGLGDVRVQEIVDFAGAEPAVVVFVERQPAGENGDAEAAQQAAARAVQDALAGLLGPETEFRRVDVVGPAVSSDLIRNGAIAVIGAVAMMLVYIWLRFEWQFALGAVLALLHDVILTFGMFSATGLVFNLPIIAAVLTIVGYSMNDTVIVYDRVRENLRKYKKMDLVELIDLSINDTISRTVMTSVTTLLALIALFVFGGEVLRGFTFAMIFGIVVGTYSSIFVAAPLLLATGVKREWNRDAAPATAGP